VVKTVTQTVVLGPYYWTTTSALVPGEVLSWALPVLAGLPGPAQQKLQSLTVTAVPMWDPKVQSLAVSDVHIVGEPSGQISVNFIITNKHTTNLCYGLKWWVAMLVP
jgi:hypothetical protein